MARLRETVTPLMRSFSLNVRQRCVFKSRLKRSDSTGGAEIARPDKTAPDQTARLNNGDHEQSNMHLCC